MRPRHDAQPRTNDLAALRATRAIDAAVPRTPTSASPSRIIKRFMAKVAEVITFKVLKLKNLSPSIIAVAGK